MRYNYLSGFIALAAAAAVFHVITMGYFGYAVLGITLRPTEVQ